MYSQLYIHMYKEICITRRNVFYFHFRTEKNPTDKFPVNSEHDRIFLIVARIRNRFLIPQESGDCPDSDHNSEFLILKGVHFPQK